MLSNKKLIAVLLVIVLAASIGSAAAIYYETNIIPPFWANPILSLAGANETVFKVVSPTMEPTIKQGSYVLVDKNVNPADLNANYPNSDIIVFHDPLDPSSSIMHRIISKEVVNGVTYYQTKGDANGNPYPQTPQSGFDPWNYNNPPGVPQDMIIGKVVNTDYK
jgi:signal peptidase I